MLDVSPSHGETLSHLRPLRCDSRETSRAHRTGGDLVGHNPVEPHCLVYGVDLPAVFLSVRASWGLEVLAADAAADGPGAVLLSADPERAGRLAAVGHLEPLAGLAGRLLPVAVLTLLVLVLAAE